MVIEVSGRNGAIKGDIMSCWLGGIGGSFLRLCDSFAIESPHTKKAAVAVVREQR